MADDDAQQRWQSLTLGYTESAGLPALRAEIAARHYSPAVVTPECVVVGAPQELVYICMQALLRPGDHVVAAAPGYESLHEVAASIGCHVDTWPLTTGWVGGWVPGGCRVGHSHEVLCNQHSETARTTQSPPLPLFPPMQRRRPAGLRPERCPAPRAPRRRHPPGRGQLTAQSNRGPLLSGRLA